MNVQEIRAFANALRRFSTNNEAAQGHIDAAIVYLDQAAYELSAQPSMEPDLAITCEKCGKSATYPVCECGNPIPRPPNR